MMTAEGEAIAGERLGISVPLILLTPAVI